MTTQKTKLEELKKRLSRGQEVVVDQRGTLHHPSDLAHVAQKHKTVVKIGRFF